MLPIQLTTRRFPGGFTETGGVLTADSAVSEPLVIESPDLVSPIFLHLLNAVTDAHFAAFAHLFWDQPVVAVETLRSLAGKLREPATFTMTGEPTADHQFEDHILNYMLRDDRLRPHMRQVGGVSRLCLEAFSTETFVKLEVACAVEVGARLMTCQHCHRAFLFGPQTGRRSHSKFCSDRCRMAAMRSRHAALNKGV